MRVIRFRVVLPIAFGFLAIFLMAWDYENQRMIGLMGMAWDMGPPFWPYQAIYLLLSMINTPAFVLSRPVLNLFGIGNGPLQYCVWFPVIIGWWWWIGTRLDFGLLGGRYYRRTKLLACILTVAAVGLLYLGASAALEEIRWWMQYGRYFSLYRAPTLLRTAGPVLWSLALAGGCLTATTRLFRPSRLR
jgi:hypothetical protein